MTGRYTVYLPTEDEADRVCYASLGSYEVERHKRCWHAFASTCRSLARDGLRYWVEWSLGEDRPKVTIHAEGRMKRRKWKPAKVSLGPSEPLTAEQCRKRARQSHASLGVLKDHFANKLARWRYSPDCYFRSYQHTDDVERRRKLGRVLAVICAMGKRGRMVGGLQHIIPTKADYRLLDEVMGFKVLRLSDLNTHQAERGYFESIVRKYAMGSLDPRQTVEDQISPLDLPLHRQIAEARADVEFWRECELLAETRERWKPGLGEGVERRDEEVRA